MKDKDKKSKISKKPKSLEDEVEELQETVRNLSLLPKSFRDIQPGSEDWELYRKHIPESREEMDRWLHGSLMVYGKELSPFEERMFRETHRAIKKCIVDPALVDDEAFETTLSTIKADDISFIYMKGWSSKMVMAVNYLASHFNWKFRAKQELTDEKGHPFV